MLQPGTLNFLKALKKNNHKVWFDENRDKYISAKNDFEKLVNEILQKIVLFDPDMKGLEAKNCMFRINRDVRFSKNKTPYKINISAYFSKGGKKSINAGYYFHLQPGENSFAGGGLWNPDAPELKKLRQEIDYCLPEFKKIIQAPAFKKNFIELEHDEDRMLVNVPKGYDKEDPAAEFLRMKSFVATKPILDSSLLSPNLAGEIATAFKALMPVIQFMNRSFE
jgi:uncharacterized protein (TIGR02453 family)